MNVELEELSLIKTFEENEEIDSVLNSIIILKHLNKQIERSIQNLFSDNFIKVR